ncbi:Uncharacterised protein [Streptococcus pneumoniae]|nr:Uncharacterised protein [Streptococcus pneumoniae]
MRRPRRARRRRPARLAAGGDRRGPRRGRDAVLRLRVEVPGHRHHPAVLPGRAAGGGDRAAARPGDPRLRGRGRVRPGPPAMWERTGLSYDDLISELLDLALERGVGLH